MKKSSEDLIKDADNHENLKNYYKKSLRRLKLTNKFYELYHEKYGKKSEGGGK